MLNEQDREKVNRHLHKVMGKCWHEWEHDGWTNVCACGASLNDDGNNPDYCSDLEPRALMNGVVGNVSMKANRNYIAEYIATAMGLDGTGTHRYIDIVFATAEDIALACYRATGGEDL